MMYAKGYSLALQGIKLSSFSVGIPPDPYCCLYGTIKGIGDVIAIIEGVVIKKFLIGASKLLSIPV